MRSDQQMTQLSQVCEVVPFDPSLKDLAVANTIDRNILGIYGIAIGRIRTHRTALGSAEMVSYGNFFTFSKGVSNRFLAVAAVLHPIFRRPQVLLWLTRKSQFGLLIVPRRRESVTTEDGPTRGSRGMAQSSTLPYLLQSKFK